MYLPYILYLLSTRRLRQPQASRMRRYRCGKTPADILQRPFLSIILGKTKILFFRCNDTNDGLIYDLIFLISQHR